MKLKEALLYDPVELLLLEADSKEEKAACMYENLVIKSINSAGISGNITRGACDDSNVPDSDFVIDNETFLLEIKYHSNSLLWSGAVRYDTENKIFSPGDKGKTEANPGKLEMFNFILKNYPALEKLTDDFDTTIKKIYEKMPEVFRLKAKNSKGFPITTTREIWETSKMELGAYPTIIPMNKFNNYLSRHKNIYYIQIGGHGLFYLTSNPANLPVPKLVGNVQLELKWKTSGGEKIRRNMPVISAYPEIIARLNAINVSPYSMDNPESIREMLKSRKQK